MFTVSPSIYSADLLNLKYVLDQVKEFKHIHLDIDDGNFVKDISFGMDLVKRIASYTDIPMDVHLEVLNPMEYIEALGSVNVSMITAHIEALPFPSQFLYAVKEKDIKAGLALNIKTPAEYLRPYTDLMDQVLFVSCEAEDAGLPFCGGVLEKIRQAKKFLKRETLIWVDGAVNEKNLPEIVRAGATGIVVGRGVFAADDPVLAYRKFVELGNSYENEMERNEK